MASEHQIKANRLNAQKSTGPKTVEGKAVVAQNAVKHGLFARKNVIQCEKQTDFDCFREKLIAGLAPVGGVEAMMAERIVSLSWRLRRVERMNSEAIDVMIAKVETNSLETRWREEAGLLDTESGKSELALGWAMIGDFSKSNVLERLLMYEKRIESSLYKAMNELKELQCARKKEQTDVGAGPCVRPGRPHEIAPTVDANHHGQDAHETQGRDALATKKQSQSPFPVVLANSVVNEKTKPISTSENGARRTEDENERGEDEK